MLGDLDGDFGEIHICGELYDVLSGGKQRDKSEVVHFMHVLEGKLEALCGRGTSDDEGVRLFVWFDTLLFHLVHDLPHGIRQRPSGGLEGISAPHGQRGMSSRARDGGRIDDRAVCPWRSCHRRRPRPPRAVPPARCMPAARCI